MKTFFIYGYVLGLTLASPITRSQECKEGLREIDNTEKNGDHGEKSAHIQTRTQSAEILQMDPTMRHPLNDTVSGMHATKDESGVQRQTSSIEIRSPITKIQHRRDLTQKVLKKKTGGKKHRPNKIIHSTQNAYNTSRKMNVKDRLKHKLEKGSIMKQLQKRSADYEDTPSDPYHSPDISYDWDSQEDINENDESQDLNESAGSTNNAEDFSSNIINENIDPDDSSEPDHTSSNESGNPGGSPESSNPVEPDESNSSNESSNPEGSPESSSPVEPDGSNSSNESSNPGDSPESSSPGGPDASNSSNESSYNIESDDSISDVTNSPIVLDDDSDSPESPEPNLQNNAFTTAATETTYGLSESKLSSESGSKDSSSESNEPDNSSKSSDSSSNESSNSSNSNTSSHSTESTTHLDNSSENSSQYIEDTEITDVIEENEIHD